ncbi:adenine nucleotide transporter [Cryptococcus deuterogattii 99/473]|uniref:Adenine nucleotide transporter n=1 Tax=Cryptococcus deuterogattii Ram5 TaxID=1296110 RepID=A0A0D0V3I5_9TREE|nr:adenine nucleotide transporter [Cryptococcus deuterogattii Ram5]KIR72444.1 adenine nucleotide transporter [Cryptococcus deuterogattii CA1014]KIY57289.1 adenine nucleotide transporter [Cryptococcus deuterogattii 99/473]
MELPASTGDDLLVSLFVAIDDPLEDIKSDDESEDAFTEKTEEEQKRHVEGKALRQQQREQLMKLKKMLGKKLQRWGMLTMLLRIVHMEGISGVFHGYGASMIGTFSQQFAYFFFHTFLRKTYLARLSSSSKRVSLSTSTELLLGALAGALAQIFTIPVSVIATRQQLWDPPARPKILPRGKEAEWNDSSPSLIETAREIIAESGWTGLWTGLKPGLVLTVNPAITYGVFERLKSWRLSTKGAKKLDVWESFWIGVGSKTLATIVTYPYIFAKVRLQAKVVESPPPLSKEIKKGEAPTYASIASNSPAESSTVLVEQPSSTESEPSTQSDQSHRRKHLHSPYQHYRSAIPLLKAVYTEKGFKGLYQGLSAQILKAVLCQG